MSGGIPKIRPDQLRDIGLFGGLDEATLAVLSENLPVVRVEIGDTVVHEGESSQEMFVVIGGELEVIKHGPTGTEVRVALIGPSDWFGEMTILDVQPRSATVRAVAPTLLLRMTAEHVETYFYRRDIRAYSIFLMNVARELSRRLRVADKIIAQVVTSVHGIAADPRARRPIAD
jgi:CRP/FNR family transcriptional regulator, cyclic AMP receptor protein